MERKPSKETEIWALADGLSKQFILRKDIHARQLEDGRYVRVNHPYTDGLMYLHLKGVITLGTYLLNVENQAKFTVLDADDDHGFEDLKKMAADLKNQNISSFLETSRRGGHLWLFFNELLPGNKARNFGLGLLDSYGMKKMEVYPKQEEHGEGPGSLIRMPFGIHRKTGERYGFVDPYGNPLGSLREQAELLTAPEKISTEAVQIYQHQPKPEYRQMNGQYEKFKDIPLVDFISQFIELRPTASGAIGKCPFHEDKVPSFGVNKKGNYWNCFAGCGGGDIIKFWMKWRNCDFKTAVGELERMIGAK